MGDLGKILSEIKVLGKGKRIVYAICDYAGHFEYLLLLNSNQIINDLEENEDGAGILKYRDNNNNEQEEIYFLEKMEV